MLKWYVIPLLSIVFYIYVTEIKKARETGNWEAIFAGITLFGMDFLNETWNGWVMALTQRSAFWTTPGDTALRTMVGWNIEIMFMFAISGIIYYHTLSKEQNLKILGLPETWFWAIGYAAFCVVVGMRAQLRRAPCVGISLVAPHIRRNMADIPFRVLSFLCGHYFHALA